METKAYIEIESTAFPFFFLCGAILLIKLIKSIGFKIFICQFCDFEKNDIAHTHTHTKKPPKFVHY